jgi:two-component system chemotaxis response regulator CheY
MNATLRKAPMKVPKIRLGKLQSKNLNILIIDDSKFIRDVVRRMLKGMGVKNVYEAANGTDGLMTVMDEKLDLILCDLSMEPVNGFEFVAALRSHESRHLRTLPVLILTIHDELDFIAHAREMGIDGYLLKPVSPLRLKERIEETLGNRCS